MTTSLPWVEPEDFFVRHAAGRSRAFWLDGSGSRPWSGRLSVVGWLERDELSLTEHAASRRVVAHRSGLVEPAGSDMFAALRERSGGPPAAGSPLRWVGWFGYAARPDLPALADPAPGTVDSCWMRVRRFVTFDHARRRVRAVAPDDQLGAWRAQVARLLAETSAAPPPAEVGTGEVVESWGEQRYREAFDAVQGQLRVGNSYETNLTFRVAVRSTAAPLDTYRRLRRINPAPYAAFLVHEGSCLLSASPERFVTITADGEVETRPIKGTTAREADPRLDEVAAQRLTREPKFRGENLMVVDLLRNDMARVCELGSVRVPDLMHVESYPTVHQLVTTIRGRLRTDVDTLDALWALFPGGSMTGAPKLRTMEIISDVEESPRGVYSGAVGWLLDDGSADLGIVIRSLVHRDGRYVLGTGGGITVSSRWDEEYTEAWLKASRLLAALGLDPLDT